MEAEFLVMHPHDVLFLWKGKFNFLFEVNIII